MKKAILFLFLAPLFASAQILGTQTNSLNFGSVNVGDKDSLQLTITNTGNQSVNVTNIKFYVIYGDYPFSASQNSFSLAAGASQNVWIYFEPEHNIMHNSELVIQHNATSGVTSVDLQGQGVFPMSYYSSTQNLEEQALKNALKTLLAQGYNQRSYSQARDFMYATIDNVNGQVECVYTGRTATFSTRSGANNNSFNCEHTFPQGFFNQNLPMRSDIHHLFPTDVNSNSQRGNLPFGIVSGSGTWSQGGSKKGGGLFEPRNVQKGRTARAMMYFVIRYQDYSSHFSVQEAILRNWHNTYSPGAFEIQRNNNVFNVQNNRNPFIDYPQLEERITNFVSNSVKTPFNGLDILQTSLNFGNFDASQPETYTYVMVNRGNQVINFSNFSISNSQYLSFASGSGNNQALNPGEAIMISVIANTQGAATQLNETLDFNTSLPGPQSSFSIPISGNAIITSLKEQHLANRIEVYPNPFQDYISIRTDNLELSEMRLVDALGKIVIQKSFNTTSQDLRTLDLSSVSKGTYFLQLISDEGVLNQRIVK
ncbi:MAG: endonuclease [Vicingaceae bacterium]